VTLRRTAGVLAAAAAVAALGCGRGGGSSASTSGRESALLGAADDEEPPDAAPPDPRELQAWERAAQGDEDEFVRLAAAIGCPGLRERAAIASLRPLALRAMGACDDLSEVGWLANVALTGPDADATMALDSIVDEAARPRRSVDPEDAEEIAVGCRTLLTLARAPDRPKARRVRAIRALRMLADRGCVKSADIPVDVK
jgi:hypothetical protein